MDRYLRAVALWEQLMAVPVAGSAIRGLVFLTGMSGAFWTVSRVCGWAALKIHGILFAEFAELFALTYNIVLAALFGGVMALAVFQKEGGSAFLVAFQAAGFVLVYLVLGAAYANEEGDVDPHSGAGFAGGIAAYLLGSLFPRQLSAHPLILRALGVTSWVLESHAGRVMLALSIIQGVLYGARRVRAWFFWKSFKIGNRRFFFEEAAPGARRIERLTRITNELRIQAA